MKDLKAFYLILLMLLAAGASWAETTYILVRHAEKDTTQEVTPLRPEGHVRAKALAQSLTSAGVNTIYSTPFCRTLQTAAPLALKVGLPIHVLKLRNLPPRPEGCELPESLVLKPVDVPAAATDLVRALRTHHANGVVLVSGHSDLLPQVLAAFDLPALRDSFTDSHGYLCENDYDNLFLVTDADGAARVVQATYGAPTEPHLWDPASHCAH